MEMNQRFFRDHLAYSRFATNKLLDACRQVGSEEQRRHNFTPFKSLLGTLLHIFQADRIWLERVQNIRQPFARAGDEELTLEEMGHAWNALFDGWEAWVTSVDDFEQPLVFHSVLLQRDLEAPLWQVLLHVVNHGSYHRGQVSMLLRQLGHESVTNDYIFYCLERDEQAKAIGR